MTRKRRYIKNVFLIFYESSKIHLQLVGKVYNGKNAVASHSNFCHFALREEGTQGAKNNI